MVYFLITFNYIAMEEYTKRVNQAYRWLLWLGVVDDKKSFAEKLGKERSNITRILNGKGSVTPYFINVILKSFPGIFNATWLKNGTGEMLVDNSSFPTYTTDVNGSSSDSSSGSGSGSGADVADKPMAEIYSIFRLDVEMLRDEVRQKYSELEREIKSVSDDLTNKIEKIKIVRHYPMESGAFQEINKAAEESQNPED
jgi:uncharacterized spore protein YtfJ